MEMLSEEVREQMAAEGRVIPTAKDRYHSTVSRNPDCAYKYKYDCRGCRYAYYPELYDSGCKRTEPPVDGAVPWSEAESVSPSGGRGRRRREI